MSADQRIAALPEHALPKRAKNALLRGGIATLHDAAEWTDRDLVRCRGAESCEQDQPGGFAVAFWFSA